MNYEQMSDFEINKAVAEALGIDWPHVDFYPDSEDPRICIDEYDSFSKEHTGTVADYCNNPDDAWPVIVENGISIIWDDEYKEYIVGEGFTNLAGCEGGGFAFTGPSIEVVDRPLRAAMIVFLMMQESTK